MLFICSMTLIKKYYSGRFVLLAAIVVSIVNSQAQTSNTNAVSEKVSHTEPLYLDLVRDLGARKGEKEFNVGADFKNIKSYNEYAFFAEYEFAPIDRLGLEIETDFSFFKKTGYNTEAPNNKLECSKLSVQYSFFVSPKYKTTLAVGYTQIWGFTDFRNYGKSNFFTGTVYNPFFVAAKRWGNNFHTLIYTSHLIKHDFAEKCAVVNWQINTSFHYSIPQTKHFIGVELNKEVNEGKFEITVRPQVKIKLNTNLAVGFVTGVPINKNGESFSSFFRIIYEP